MRYVSIDLETTGLDPTTCQIVEFGAVIEDLGNLKPVESLPTFHAYVLSDDGTYRGEPYALSMHAEIFRRIAKKEPGWNYLLPIELASRFRVFLDNNGIPLTKNGNISVAAGGKNFAAFDLPFIKRHIPMNGVGVFFHHRCVDPGMLFLDPTMEKIPDSKQCMELAEITGEVSHTAVEDAQMVVRLVRKGLKL